MRRILQFFILLAVILSIWFVALKIMYNCNGTISTYFIIPFPVHLLILFGVYSIFTVLHRTLNFNDCPEASKELTAQIEEAKIDLKRRGLKF